MDDGLIDGDEEKIVKQLSVVRTFGTDGCVN